MGIVHRSIPNGANRRHPSSGLFHPGTKLVFLLVVYLTWTPGTMSQHQGWKARARRTLEKFGWKHPAPVVLPDDASVVAEPATPNNYRKHRIPCGLILVNAPPGSFGDDVAPLATSAVAELVSKDDDDDDDDDSSPSSHAASTLHARALQQYPHIKRYVVSSSKGKKYVPKGTFRLRMGSEESTIEESPLLWIIENEGSDNDGDDDKTIDLVLGTSFWKDHSAEFESDEIYLFTSSPMDAEETTRTRVMVPYLLMRSRISFNTEL